jgi:hypothetical protein
MNNLKDLDNDPNIVWEKRISANGKEYSIGYHKDAEKLDTSLEKTPFNTTANWPPVFSSAPWIVQTSAFIGLTGISRYALDQRSASLYTYKLHFTNQVHYDYYFTDNSGDIYECNTFRNGDHYVRYNSDSPTIINISGS